MTQTTPVYTNNVVVVVGKSDIMGVVAASLVLTIVAVLCQGLAIALPGWIIKPESLSTLTPPQEEQYGIWYYCFGWKNCDDYFSFFSANADRNRRMGSYHDLSYEFLASMKKIHPQLNLSIIMYKKKSKIKL